MDKMHAPWAEKPKAMKRPKEAKTKAKEAKVLPPAGAVRPLESRAPVVAPQGAKKKGLKP